MYGFATQYIQLISTQTGSEKIRKTRFTAVVKIICRLTLQRRLLI